jgi:hypothetical protein
MTEPRLQVTKPCPNGHRTGPLKFASVENMLDAANWTTRLGELADGIPYVFLGGRITPRVE